jgi:hypothetical protein
VYALNGGAGGFAIGNYSVTPGANISVTVGTGGSQGNGASAGGSSSFGSYCSASGGGAARGYSGGGAGFVGAGTGGTISNSNSYNSYGQQVFAGALWTSIDSFSGASTNSQSGSPNRGTVTYSATLGTIPGAPGWISGGGECPYYGTGGVGGAVLVEY